jgi:WD40 repeat protein
MAAPRITHATIFAHFGYVHGLTTSGDGKTLVSASEDGTVKLWDLPGGKLRAAYDDYKSPVLTACLSADGHSLLSGHQDKFARSRSLDKPDEMLEEFECGTPVVAVRFTADGSRFATSGADKSLPIWDRETQKRLKCLLKPMM